MNIVEIQGLRVQGLSVCTCNADEADPDRARIAALWADFAVQVAPKMAQGAMVYGVYHRYASDVNGAYELLVGADGFEPQVQVATAPWQTVHIHAGLYGVFRAQGAMPQAVIEAWQQVWAYFADPRCPHQRAHTTDFERYAADATVDIFIALVAT